MFMLRFDMRAPSFGAPTTELYAAALEMASLAESRGALVAAICEHHTMEDGYLPSPLVLATAMAARTSTLPIMTAALDPPAVRPGPARRGHGGARHHQRRPGQLHHGGRLPARGVRAPRRRLRRRGRLVEDQLALLLQAKTGEPFEHEGRRIHVTPAPVTPGGPA